MKFHTRLFAAGVLALSSLSLAHAAEPVLIPKTVKVSAAADPATLPSPSCTWGSELAKEIARRSGGAAKPTDLAPEAVPGRYLAFEATMMKLESGYMAPKWIRLRGDMMEAGKVIATFEFYRTTGHDAGTPCAQAHYLGDLLAKRIGKWIRRNGQLPAEQLVAMQKTPEAKDDADEADAAE
jgi:hypothetical protein